MVCGQDDGDFSLRVRRFHPFANGNGFDQGDAPSQCVDIVGPMRLADDDGLFLLGPNVEGIDSSG